MRLDAWLRQHRRKRSEFAREIGVSPQLITGYCKGEFWPSRDKAEKIAEVTQGAVTANDFMREAAE